MGQTGRMEWNKVAENVTSGAVVALMSALLAVGLIGKYTAKREGERARRERNLAAAAELYRVHGVFFAAWKAWSVYLDDGGAKPERRSAILDQAVTAEGGYESLVVRIALEHDLSADQQAVLWSLRIALKRLRGSIGANDRLLWWRSDIRSGPLDKLGYREYAAFKTLIAVVGKLLIDSGGPPPGEQHRATALQAVTGSGADFKKRFAHDIEKEGKQRQANGVPMPTNWEWLPIAEQISASHGEDKPAPAWWRRWADRAWSKDQRRHNR